MTQGPPQTVSLWLPSAMAVAVWACLAVWGVLLWRLCHRQAVMPYRPRRPVPWQGIDLLLFLAIYLAISLAIGFLGRLILGPEVTEEPKMYEVTETDSVHPIGKLLAEGDPWVVWLCALSVVAVAPIAEELLIRIVLQGWLEALERRLRRKTPTLRRLIPRAVVPIVLTSLLFGLMHFRVEGPPRHPNYDIFRLVLTVVVGLAMTVVAILWLRIGRRATAVDLGWVPERFFADVRLGLVAFAGVAAPVYALQAALHAILPKGFAPDPIPLFFFALVLGTLYYRTHRIVPVIVLHLALNTTTLAAVLLALRK